MHPSTATTLTVLASGAIGAATWFILGKRWTTMKDVPPHELLAAVGAYGAILAVAWHYSSEKPNMLQVVASGIRGASRGGI